MNGLIVTLVCGVVARQYQVFKGQYLDGNAALIVQDLDNQENKAVITTHAKVDYNLVQTKRHPVVRELIRKQLLIPQGVATDGRYLCEIAF